MLYGLYDNGKKCGLKSTISNCSTLVYSSSSILCEACNIDYDLHLDG